MKKVAKVLSLIAAPFMLVCAFLTGCKSCKGHAVDIENDNGIMQDMNTSPDVSPFYENQSRQLINEYKAVAARNLNESGETDMFNPEVLGTAKSTAAKLFAYACYNERYLDRYVYFSDQTGVTDMGSTGSATALRQEYYLRVNETEKTCGYRYHYTIKKVTESSGTVGTFKGQFESARMRFTDKTNLLYRFEGNSIAVGEYNPTLECYMLTCDWRTGSDWGKADVEMVKGDYLTDLESIEADIVEYASDDNHTIRANINILAENIVKFASISEDEDDGCINIMMTIDTEVANKDVSSVKMLTKSNGTSGDCNWKSYVDPDEPDAEGFSEDTGLRLIIRLWPNGLFRSYTVIERWRGKIVMFSGTAESLTTVSYSYSERDCDMTEHLKMLDEAKARV